MRKETALLVIAMLWGSIGYAQVGDIALTSNPVFQKNCAKCHGKTGEGRHFGGPSLVSEDARNMTADELRNIIMNGKHRMPKYTGKLTADEIDTLVTPIKAGAQM